LNGIKRVSRIGKHKWPTQKPATLAAYKKLKPVCESVKDEMRRNLIAKLKSGETLFPGIIGYDKTVIPSITNAISHAQPHPVGARGREDASHSVADGISR